MAEELDSFLDYVFCSKTSSNALYDFKHFVQNMDSAALSLAFKNQKTIAKFFLVFLSLPEDDSHKSFY